MRRGATGRRSSSTRQARRPAEPPPGPTGPPTRPEDLPLLYLLLTLNLALIALLPIGALSLKPVLSRLVATGQIQAATLWMLGAAWIVVEAGFIWRARRVWTRIRSVRSRAR